jgi:hypothetical protein
MTIFDIIGSILVNKKQIELNLDNENEFNLYMTNRWLSMYSADVAGLINNTVNKWWNIFDNKQEQYNFLYHLMPKCRFKRINYIKKNKKETTKDTEDYSALTANSMCISTRELKMYQQQIEQLQQTII